MDVEAVRKKRRQIYMSRVPLPVMMTTDEDDARAYVRQTDRQTRTLKSSQVLLGLNCW